MEIGGGGGGGGGAGGRGGAFGEEVYGSRCFLLTCRSDMLGIAHENR